MLVFFYANMVILVLSWGKIPLPRKESLYGEEKECGVGG